MHSDTRTGAQARELQAIDLGDNFVLNGLCEQDRRRRRRCRPSSCSLSSNLQVRVNCYSMKQQHLGKVPHLHD